MAVRVITTEISIKNEAEFKRQISSINNSLKSMQSAMKLLDAQYEGQTDSAEYLTKKQKLLQEQYDQQKVKVQALSKMLDSARSVYDENSSVVTRYKTQLDSATIQLLKMEREVKNVSSAMESASKSTVAADKQIAVFDKTLNDAGDSADDAADQVENFDDAVEQAGDNADDSSDGLGDFAKELQNLQTAAKSGNITGVVSSLQKIKGLLAGAAIVTGIKEIGEAILNIVEDTKEFRQIVGTLQTSAEEAGYTLEQTAELFRDAYSVFSDEQVAATVVANLQAMNLSQAELKKMLELTEGAWATYGDSIPVDSLAESINETAQTAKVTGTFADVLNWAGINEDKFNEALAALPDTAARANLMMTTMADEGLDSTAEAWKENNKEIQEYNAKQLELKEATARLGESLSPVASAFTDFGISAVNALASITDTVIGTIDKIKEFKAEYNDWANSIPVLGPLREKAIENQTYYREHESLGAKFKNWINGSHANGLDYVPFDGYVAELHQGEAVLTSGEASFLRSAMAAGRTLGGSRRSSRAVSDSDTGGSGGTPKVYDLTIPVELTIDGATFARKEYKYRIAEDNRRGVSLAGRGGSR